MHGIWIMAAITLALSIVIWGGLIYVIGRKDWRCLLLALAGLPLSAIVNLWVKTPLIMAVSRAGGVDTGLSNAPVWFVIFFAFVPPVTEELIKVVPLLIPRARRLLDRGLGAFAAGMALGVGFGLGEALYLAYNVSTSFVYAGMPWYVFTGYLFERFTVTFMHGVITALFVMGLSHRGWRAATGFLAAVFLHLLLNLPIILQIRGLISPTAMSIAFQLTLMALAALFVLLYRQARRSSNATAYHVEQTYYERAYPTRTGSPPGDSL
ncbi:MAG TPA: hypothetical protein VLH85_00430 [Levilinea sp.]|nr:hypothetical protein [Levilinea sp.]